MKDYKRLTPRDLIEVINSNDRENIAFLNYAMRLHTLEDKIENGTLIELPCKVGDTVYEIIPKCNGGLDCPFNGGFGGGRCSISCKEYIQERKFDAYLKKYIGKSIFLTKAKAEQKLKNYKELKREV